MGNGRAVGRVRRDVLRARVIPEQDFIRAKLLSGATIAQIHDDPRFSSFMSYEQFRRVVRKFVAGRGFGPVALSAQPSGAAKAQQTPTSTPIRAAQANAEPSASDDTSEIKYPPGSRRGNPSGGDGETRKFIFNPRYTRPSEAANAQTPKE